MLAFAFKLFEEMSLAMRISFSMIIVFVTADSFAQNTASSPYSVYGAGIINEKSTFATRSMGGSGIALQDAYNLNPSNPASYVWIKPPISHLYEFGISAEKNLYQTNQLTTNQSNGALSNINYWFKFKPWWAGTIGIAPYSTVSYNIKSTKTLAASSEADYLYTGSGSNSQVYFGNGFKLMKNLSAGINLTYIFGSVERTEAISNTVYAEALVLENRIFTSKLTADYGIQYKVNVSGKKSIVFGAVYNNSISMKGTSKISLYNTVNDTLANYSGKTISYTVPQKIGGGISFVTPRSIFELDLQFKPWSKASYSFVDKTFVDVWRYSIGYAYVGNSNSSTLLGALSFRTGLYYQNHYLQIKNNTLPEYGLSLSTGIPVFDGKSTINLSYQFSRFGTLQNNLIMQTAQKISFDLVIRDLWGYKRKFE